MDIQIAEPFTDNWAYIKTELNWLDRVLVMAVGRHRRDLKETESMTRNARDRVTRHWWKGVITLDQSPNYDEYRPGAVRETFYPGSPAHNPGTPLNPAHPSPTPSSVPAPPGANSLNHPTMVNVNTGNVNPGAINTGAMNTGNHGGNHGGGSLANPALPPPAPSYQDQLAARIQATRQQGILLGLPALQERLGLTLFEKNLVLLSLAPEVNRRYSRLYGVLQESDQSERPLVDLAFKLFCRNDQEWQAARIRLGTRSPLVQYGLVSFVTESDQPLLTQTLKLTAPLVNFLLSEHLNDRCVEELLQSHLQLAPVELAPALPLTEVVSPIGASLTEATPRENPSPNCSNRQPVNNKLVNLGTAPTVLAPNPIDFWKQLILPREHRERLEQLVAQSRRHLSNPTTALAPVGHHSLGTPKGSLVIFTGAKGTGKTLTAQALAQSLDLPLFQFHFHHYSPEQYSTLLQSLRSLPAAVTLLEPYGAWLGRRSPLASLGLQEWIHTRRSRGEMIICEGEFAIPLPQWIRGLVDAHLTFSLPNATQRLALWQQALGREMALDLSVDWHSIQAKLAHQYCLSGSEIDRIARDAGYYAHTLGEMMITPRHIYTVIQQKDFKERK